MNWKPIETAPKDGRWIVVLWTYLGTCDVLTDPSVPDYQMSVVRWDAARKQWENEVNTYTDFLSVIETSLWAELPSKESIKAALKW